MRQREEARDGHAILGCHADLDLPAQAIYYIVKPSHRLWGQGLPAAGLQQQIVELLHERCRSSFLVRQAHAFRASDHLLASRLGEAAQELAQVRPKVDPVEVEDPIRSKSCAMLDERIHRS